MRDHQGRGSEEPKTSRSAAAPGPDALYLSEHVYCCESDGGAVLLDLHSNRYLGVHAADIPCLKARIANWPASSHAVCEVSMPPGEMHATSDSLRLLADLQARGILTHRVSPTREYVKSRPSRSLSMTGRAICTRWPSLPPLTPFLLDIARVRRHLRDGNLEPLFERLRRLQSALRPTPRDEARITHSLTLYCRLRAWTFTARDACLLDSSVLSFFLTRAGVPCSLVIGIATKPFLAHAWVQSGDIVLNDTAEYTQTFTPILVIGG